MKLSMKFKMVRLAFLSIRISRLEKKSVKLSNKIKTSIIKSMEGYNEKIG